MIFQLVFNFTVLYLASIYLLFDISVGRFDKEESNKNQIGALYSFNVYALIFSTLLDIMKGFNTAFYFKGIICEDRIQIRNKYIKSYFFFDILSFFSVVVNKKFFPEMDYLVMYFFQCLFFMKFHLIIQIIKQFNKSFDLSESSENIIKLMRLIVFILFLAHIIAISYHVYFYVCVCFFKENICFYY